MKNNAREKFHLKYACQNVRKKWNYIVIIDVRLCVETKKNLIVYNTVYICVFPKDTYVVIVS